MAVIHRNTTVTTATTTTTTSTTTTAPTPTPTPTPYSYSYSYSYYYYYHRLNIKRVSSDSTCQTRIIIAKRILNPLGRIVEKVYKGIPVSPNPTQE